MCVSDCESIDQLGMHASPKTIELCQRCHPNLNVQDGVVVQKIVGVQAPQLEAVIVSMLKPAAA